MILGCDLSTEYRNDFVVGQAMREGMSFVAVKLYDSLKGSDRYEDGVRILRTAQSLGMPCWGYAFLRAGADPVADAGRFSAQLERAGVSGALDWESAGDSKPDVDQLRNTVGELWAQGARVCFTYAPRWYWEQQGSPSLAGLPPLWASRYVGTAAGSPGELVGRVDPSWWNSYGGRPVRVLQYSSTATVLGAATDVNVYQGSVAQLWREVRA